MNFSKAKSTSAGRKPVISPINGMVATHLGGEYFLRPLPQAAVVIQNIELSAAIKMLATTVEKNSDS